VLVVVVVVTRPWETKKLADRRLQYTMSNQVYLNAISVHLSYARHTLKESGKLSKAIGCFHADQISHLTSYFTRPSPSSSRPSSLARLRRSATMMTPARRFHHGASDPPNAQRELLVSKTEVARCGWAVRREGSCTCPGWALLTGQPTGYRLRIDQIGEIRGTRVSTWRWKNS
jgi:hypothetical protein